MKDESSTGVKLLKYSKEIIRAADCLLTRHIIYGDTEQPAHQRHNFFYTKRSIDAVLPLPNVQDDTID